VLDLDRARLRANPGYELVLSDHLDLTERRSLMISDDLFGILRPRPAAKLEWRTASPDTALLFFTLRKPGSLPSYVRHRLGAERGRVVGRLILDGILQIEYGGRFISGARAGKLLFAEPPDAGRGRIGIISRAALRYGAELATLGQSEPALTSRLYCYGRVPITATLRRRFAENAIDEHLGIDQAGPVRRSLDDGWIQTPSPPDRGTPWITWRPRLPRNRDNDGDAGYKLYVSPDIEGLGSAFAAVVRALSGRRGLTGLKVAASVDGFCRPDKLVAYFERLEDLQESVEDLRVELDGVAAHGVPFTAAIAADGLLSWASDPSAPAGARLSWRYWLCARLAEFLLVGASQGGDAAQFALARLTVMGVDTDSWVATDGMWQHISLTG
jgi:hypothetical protein